MVLTSREAYKTQSVGVLASRGMTMLIATQHSWRRNDMWWADRSFTSPGTKGISYHEEGRISRQTTSHERFTSRSYNWVRFDVVPSCLDEKQVVLMNSSSSGFKVRVALWLSSHRDLSYQVSSHTKLVPHMVPRLARREGLILKQGLIIPVWY